MTRPVDRSTDSTERCRRYRRQILDISQSVSALHVAPAFSCTELVDVIYNEVMHHSPRESESDVFLMSKGHGCMILYVILAERGRLTAHDLATYCKPEGRLGAHPDLGVPGIAASTGSLGHGLSIALGQAYAERLKNSKVTVYCVLSDGELQEGSTWEAILMSANLGLGNLVAVIDNNDFSGLERMSEGHKAFYPIVDKLVAFGWETATVDGHDADAIRQALQDRTGTKPFALVAKTVKGKGVSFMENENIWHYRSPNKEEYAVAIEELSEGSK